MVIEAGQPEILRAGQRDQIFQRQLAEDISQIVSGVFGMLFFVISRKTGFLTFYRFAEMDQMEAKYRRWGEAVVSGLDDFG